MLEKEIQEDVRIRRNLGTWKGGLFENIAGEALIKAGIPLAYFKRENSTLEMDFLTRSTDSIIPIEVKAENNRSKSLRMLIDSKTYKDIHWGIKLVNGNVGFENGILTIPQWCAFKLPEIISNFDSSN
jgi:predicted AAA+ superfamily ATPase